jgi:hypothetical protein
MSASRHHLARRLQPDCAVKVEIKVFYSEQQYWRDLLAEAHRILAAIQRQGSHLHLPTQDARKVDKWLEVWRPHGPPLKHVAAPVSGPSKVTVPTTVPLSGPPQLPLFQLLDAATRSRKYENSPDNLSNSVGMEPDRRQEHAQPAELQRTEKLPAASAATDADAGTGKESGAGFLPFTPVHRNHQQQHQTGRPASWDEAEEAAEEALSQLHPSGEGLSPTTPFRTHPLPHGGRSSAARGSTAATTAATPVSAAQLRSLRPTQSAASDAGWSAGGGGGGGGGGRRLVVRGLREEELAGKNAFMQSLRGGGGGGGGGGGTRTPSGAGASAMTTPNKGTPAAGAKTPKRTANGMLVLPPTFASGGRSGAGNSDPNTATPHTGSQTAVTRQQHHPRVPVSATSPPLLPQEQEQEHHPHRLTSYRDKHGNVIHFTPPGAGAPSSSSSSSRVDLSIFKRAGTDRAYQEDVHRAIDDNLKRIAAATHGEKLGFLSADHRALKWK